VALTHQNWSREPFFRCLRRRTLIILTCLSLIVCPSQRGKNRRQTWACTLTSKPTQVQILFLILVHYLTARS